MEYGRRLEVCPQDQVVEIGRPLPSTLEELVDPETVRLHCDRTRCRTWYHGLHYHLRTVHEEVEEVEASHCRRLVISVKGRMVCLVRICLGTRVLQMQIFGDAEPIPQAWSQCV